MTLRTNDHQAACFSRFLIKLDIRSTSGHIGGNRHCPVNTGICNDLRLHFMELGIQNLMLDAILFKQRAQFLGRINIDRADQYRLPFVMGFSNGADNRFQLLFSCFIYRILMIDTRNRLIGRNLHYIHTVDIAELFFLGERGTGHTCFFLKFIKEILEGNSRQRLTLPFYLHMLLCLDGLMQTVRITASRHDTSGKLIHNQYLIVFHHIILITEHQIMRPQREYDIMLDFQILRVSQILNLEEPFHFCNTLCRKVHDLVLLIDNKVASLLTLNTHDRVNLGKFFHVLPAGKLSGQNITGLIQLRGLAALSGYNERCTRFVDKHRIHLVDDGVMQVSEDKLFFIDNHIITQIVKTKLIVGHICDITVICLSALIRLHIIQDNTHF